MIRIGAILLAMLALSACASTKVAGSGSTVRAFADSGGQAAPAAAIVDAMAGGLIGGQIGANLDHRERRKALEAESRALEYMLPGQPVGWGDKGKRSGEVVAGSPYRVGSQDCRQYTHEVMIDGRSATARGAACRNPNGSWTPLI